ncbi:MAG: glycosyltransferase [Vicinamibacterales bacterium]
MLAHGRDDRGGDSGPRSAGRPRGPRPAPDRGPALCRGRRRRRERCAGGGAFERLRELPGVTVLRHARNAGKGAALKTAFAYIQQHLPEARTIVTADADGQHRPDDIARVAETAAAHPDAAVLGVRQASRGTPFRSRLGNWATRHLYAWLVGQRVSDTQTGLRAIPRARLAELARLEGAGYEYELNMLIHLRQRGVALREVPIATVYEDGNRGSHFRPVRDSWRIYSVLLRFALVSVATAGVDNLAFLAASAWGMGPLATLAIARVAGASFNYPVVTRWVFREAARGLPTLAPYLLLVACHVVAARISMAAAESWGGLTPFGAKIAWETLFFLPNFLLQRDLIFRSARPDPDPNTDWTAYYDSVPVTARLTRKYAGRRLVAALAQAARASAPVRHVMEFGGASSCFLDRVCLALRPATYVVVDTNARGLSRLQSWHPPAGVQTALELVQHDVRHMDERPPVDVVFSVGLIEHFDVAGTREVLDAHLAMVRPGGAVVVSYPTPTWLYVVTRRVLESLRLWKFPDERPLRFDEVEAAVGGRAAVIERRVLWPLLLTQEMVVLVKR